MQRNCYEFFGVDEEARPDQIEAAYAQVMAASQDRQDRGEPDADRDIFFARECRAILSDPRKRASYDGKLHKAPEITAAPALPTAKAPTDATAKERQNPKMGPCKTCGATIAITAQVCPQCGQRNPVKIKYLNAIFWSALTLAIVVGWLVSHQGPADETANSPDDDHADLATVICHENVKSRLKAPASADFPFGDYAVRADNQTYQLISYVDSQNAFGAQLRTRFRCGMRFTGGDPHRSRNWELLVLEMSPQ